MAPAEFTSIAQALRPKLLVLGRDFFGDAEAAEDAVQEALIRLWAVWGELPSQADAERLAVRLTKHACINAQRRRHADVMVPLGSAQASVVSSRWWPAGASSHAPTSS